MRLNEIASAEEQMALWKLVSDSVWSAISQQAKQEAEARAAKQRAAKLKPRATRTISSPKPLPLKPLPPKSATPTKTATVQQPEVRKTSPFVPKSTGSGDFQDVSNQPTSPQRQA